MANAMTGSACGKEDPGGGEKEHRPDGQGSEGLDLAVAVGVLRVRGLFGEVEGDDPDDVREGVEPRMNGIRYHAHRPGEDAKDRFCKCDGEV